jgi:phosphatidylglycerophosphate synthase
MKRKPTDFLNINSNPSVLQLRDKIISPFGYIIIRFRIPPSIVTLSSLLLGCIAAILVSQGIFKIAGVFLLISLIADGLDGFIARKTDSESLFGAFIDGVCDRYVDLAVMFGLVWYFSINEYRFYMFLVFIAIIGAAITSYSTPLALSLSLAKSKEHIGFFGRVQRIIILVLAFIFPGFVFIASWILAIFSNLTAFHRIVHYYFLSRSMLNKNNPES